MVKNIYKETAKAGKSPIWLAIGWIVFIYVFYILWGIGEILLEIKTPLIMKHIVIFGLTTGVVWTIIYKYLVVYDITAKNYEFTIARKISRKNDIICSAKYENIEAIITKEEKFKIKEYKINKKRNIVRAHQVGKKVYVIYKFNDKLNMMTLKLSREMLSFIRKKKEDNQ